MSRFGRSARMLVAGALILSTATLLAASPASALSGSMQDNGDGTMTVTYDLTGGTPGQGVSVLFFPAGAPCTPGSGEVFFLSALVSGGGPSPLAASPAVIAEGTTAFIQGAGSGPIPAGTFTACLGTNQGIQREFQMTFGTVAPPTTTTTTTTTTTLPTTTTTTTAPGGVESTTTTVASVAAGDPVTPAFTG